MIYKKAQAGPIGFIIFVMVFMILWFVWIGKWLADVGQQAIVDGGLTGIEAFAYANLNIWVFIGLILGVVGYLYFASGD